jgi:hypothetical protein
MAHIFFHLLAQILIGSIAVLLLVLMLAGWLWVLES